MDREAPELMAERQRWGPEVVVLQPTRFEALQEAVLALRDHATVLLNLSALPPDQKQRAADFMAGGAFALDGQQERLGEQVFLFAPHFVQLHHD
ncbi:MAG: cell division protein SepF [Vulcanococcus sp.]|nr:cell division protein SepF [Cyanobacteria bacterium M_DeepCast_200m_mx_001]